MKNVKLLTIVAMCLLMTSIFAVIPAFSVQPPLTQSVYYVGTIGQPKNLDPARAYDTASGEIIQNIYQSLIWYDSRNVINFTAGVGYNVSSSDLSNLGLFKPVIATQLPTIANGGIVTLGNGSQIWTFTINTNAQFQQWTAANGTLMGPANVTVADVVYSFQRQMIYDSSAAPTWMWYQTAFNPAWYTWDDAFGYTSAANGTFTVPADEATAAHLIQQWVHAGAAPNTVVFQFNYPFAPTAMYQIFSQTWGSILEKDWVIEHGGWNGLFTAGWTNNYRQKPSNDYSELDVYKDPAIYGQQALGGSGSKYPGVTGSNHVPDMDGTGPYCYTSWDKTIDTWRIDYNPSFWQGWGSAGDGAGNYIKTVIEAGIASWPTRKMLFLNGEEDAVVVPTANMYDLLSSTYNPIAGINMEYNIPTLQTDEFFFTTNLTATSSYQSYVGYPGHTTGAEALFFADQNIRTAFAWAFNYTEYINAVWFGQAIQHGSWWATGLTPVNANDTFLNPQLRNVNLANMKYYLDQAALIDGKNVSTDGFDVTFLYNTGNTQRQIACQALADSWNALNSKYHVNVVGVDWNTFLTLMVTKGMAGYCLGWLADFADAVDFAGVYMSSSGSFSVFQGPPYPADQATIDAEVTQASTQTDPVLRVNEYHDLEQRYYTDCLSIALDQPVGRGWARDWVQGRWINQLLPGLFAYLLYKANPAPVPSVTLDITHTITPITTYTKVYWYKGTALIGNGNGNKAIYDYSLKVEYVNGTVLTLAAAIGMEILNGSYTGLASATPPGRIDAYQYPNSTVVLMAPGGTATVELTWTFDGKNTITLPYPDASNPANFWNISGVTNPLAAQQSAGNAFLLSVNDSQTIAEGPLIGDIKPDGVVNVLDAIRLGNVFGLTDSSKLWNPDANLHIDAGGAGHQVINILDAIVLGNHFGQHFPL